MTEEIKSINIHQRLHAIMSAVKYVQKSEKTVNGQYRFVTHDSVSASIQPELINNGVLIVTSVKDYKQDGNRTCVDLEISFVNIDNPEDKLIINAFGYGIDTQDKGPGKAISYAVKYALLKTFCLETGDDPENDLVEHKPAPKQPPIKRIAALPAKLTKAEQELHILLLEQLTDLIAKKVPEEDRVNLAAGICNKAQVGHFSELPLAGLQWAINIINKKYS